MNNTCYTEGCLHPIRVPPSKEIRKHLGLQKREGKTKKKTCSLRSSGTVLISLLGMLLKVPVSVSAYFNLITHFPPGSSHVSDYLKVLFVMPVCSGDPGLFPCGHGISLLEPLFKLFTAIFALSGSQLYLNQKVFFF